MLLIMDHNPLVYLSEKGLQFGNSSSCLRGFSPGCRLVNTRPSKPRRERGSELSIFVWVFYYGILFFVSKKKKVLGILHQKTTSSWGTLESCMFSSSPLPPFRPLFPSNLVFNFVGAERKEDASSSENQGRAGSALHPRGPVECPHSHLTLWIN